MINIFSAKSIELTTVVVYMIHVPTVEESGLESILLMPKNRETTAVVYMINAFPP